MEMKMIEKRTCNEFQETGLFLLVNQLLFVFGWCIAMKDEDGRSYLYPAKVKYIPKEPMPHGYIKTICKHIRKEITKHLKRNT